MKLYLIRHAESTNNVLWGERGTDSVPGRSPDPEITDTGHKQAALLANHVMAPGTEPRQHPFDSDGEPSYQFTHLYCSLMSRSLQTADYIQKICQLELEALPDIYERMGLYESDGDGRLAAVAGPGRSYFETRFPQVKLPDSLTEEGWWNRPIESDQEFFIRVDRSLQSVINRHGDSNDCVALVVHGDYLDQCINHLMNVPRAQNNYKNAWVANWVFHNTSISRIDINNQARNVIYLNRIDHLPLDHVTW